MLTYDDKLPVPLFATNTKQVAEQYIRRYERAKNHRENFVPLFEECYEYALPMRESFYHESIGKRRDDKIFDETAVVGVQEFASRLQSGLVPNFARWADFTAGSEVPKEEKDEINNTLDEVTDYVFEVIQNSNFAQEVHESFMDLAVGTGILAVNEGDAVHPIQFNAIPLPHVVLDIGHDDNIDHVFRVRHARCDQLMLMYPKAQLSETLKKKCQKEPDAKIEILEVVCKDYTVKNDDGSALYAIVMESKEVIFQEQYKGVGSNPYVCFRWAKCAGEVYGRGPLVNALSAIKTTNLTIELVLENAQMAISGIYQMDDDGVINPDTINLVPGTIIPKAPNSLGLQPVASAGSFDVASLVLNDMRLNIKRALYNDMLGDPNKTPASATEVAERMADLSRRIGSAFGRLQVELVQPVLQRVVYILKKQGRIEIPTINGREVKVRSVSPLAQAQHNQDITSVHRFLEMVQRTFGPEILNILINSEETAAYLAKKFGVPDTLIRDAEERRQLVQMAQQMAQQQAMQQAQAQTLGDNPQADAQEGMVSGEEQQQA
ncbi:MAG: phage tail protein [Rhodopirellula sp.]|nr:phage tail protein [Rhodopirellula sp.]|tara:strand:+ start:1245 stop:2891 length:1647 start_codon:yes stop_codon:yes gene_type:complete